MTTFDELRRQMREAQEKAEKDARTSEQGKEEKQPQKADKPQKEYEVDFNVKETGQKKQLAGYDAREVVMTITVREKGKTLEDSGGFVMTADSWLGPQIAALKELHEFDSAYWKQLQGPDAMGMSPEQLATVIAMYPMVKQATERMQKEGAEAPGHSARDDDDVRGGQVEGGRWRSRPQSSSSSGGGGLGGMLARKMAKKDNEARSRGDDLHRLGRDSGSVRRSVAAADVQHPDRTSRKRSSASGDARKVDHEARPLPFLALDVHPAVCLLDDPVHGRQAEPGSLPLVLGGEERLEDVRAHAFAATPLPVSATVSVT